VTPVGPVGPVAPVIPVSPFNPAATIFHKAIVPEPPIKSTLTTKVVVVNDVIEPSIKFAGEADEATLTL
jgi:hypothetical protein